MSARPPAKSFEALAVRRKAHEFVLGVYGLTMTSPKEETYDFTSQLRRAAVTIAANIAKGFRKRGKADKARFMNTAGGTVDESHYYLILARDLGYGHSESLMRTLDEVSRPLNAYSGAILASNF